MPVTVDAGGQEHDRVDDPATLNLHRERVRGHERERARITQGSVAELLDELVQVGVHTVAIRDTWEFDRESIPSCLTSLSIRRVDTPAR